MVKIKWQQRFLTIAEYIKKHIIYKVEISSFVLFKMPAKN